MQLIVSRKLNEEYKNEDATESDWELFKLTEFLKTELEAGEKCHQSYQGKSPTTKKYATAAALITGDGKTNRTFCRGKHSASYCHVITDINEHKKILRKAARCFLCLRKAGHLARDCDSSIRCFCCKGHHHIALYEKNIKFVGSQPDGGTKAGGTQIKLRQKQTVPFKHLPRPTPMNNSHKMLTVVSVLRKKLRGQVYYCRQHLLQRSILGFLTRRLILEQ